MSSIDCDSIYTDKGECQGTLAECISCHPLVFASKLLSTVCALVVATFLIINYSRFKKRINSCMSLQTYYIAALVSVAMDVCTSWMLRDFNKVYWIFPFQIATFAEAIMALAYSAIMFELAQKIKIIDITKDSSEGDKEKHEKNLVIKLRRFLSISIIIMTIVFITTTSVFGWSIHSGRDKGPGEHTKEILAYTWVTAIQWTVFTIIDIILIVSGVKAVQQLKKMFGQHFNSEICWLQGVLVVFCVAFLTRTAYNWVQFVNFQTNQSFYKDSSKFKIQLILLPIVWDMVPIVAILYTHHHNFQNENLEQTARMTTVSVTRKSTFRQQSHVQTESGALLQEAGGTFTSNDRPSKLTMSEYEDQNDTNAYDSKDSQLKVTLIDNELEEESRYEHTISQRRQSDFLGMFSERTSFHISIFTKNRATMLKKTTSQFNKERKTSVFNVIEESNNHVSQNLRSCTEAGQSLLKNKGEIKQGVSEELRASINFNENE